MAAIFRKIILSVIISTGFFMSCMTVNAQSLYKWVDAEGNVTYQDRPPPDDVQYERQSYTGPTLTTGESDKEIGRTNEIQAALNLAAENNPVTVYSIPNCDACDLVRLFLEKKQIPFIDKNIKDDLSTQQELLEKTDSLLAPTVSIGDKIIDGYSKSALREALMEKEYPLESLESQNENEATEIPAEG